MGGAVAWPPSMKTKAHGVVQWRATAAESPTTATTVASNPADQMVRRKEGRVSSIPVAGSTSDGSCHSQPGCCSSEPR